MPRIRFVLMACGFLGALPITADKTAQAETFTIDVVRPGLVYPGNTIFADTSDRDIPRILEVDINGNVVWEYEIPPAIANGGRPGAGLDVEWVPETDNILFVMPDMGVYEVNRAKKIVWSHETKASHDADRLVNGNTLIAWGWDRDPEDPNVIEVDKDGKVVWRWHARDHFSEDDIRGGRSGFAHVNAVVRLKNGNTLISPRNFNTLVEVDPSGKIVWKLADVFTFQHDPEILPNGNILVASRRPDQIMEVTRDGEVTWRFRRNDVETVRYNHRLPNGNTILVERTKILEITPSKEVVWRLSLKGVDRTSPRRGGKEKWRWLYKAERIPLER